MIRHLYEKTHVTNNLKLEYVREWKKNPDGIQWKLDFDLTKHTNL